jgi:hypothetical protein
MKLRFLTLCLALSAGAFVANPSHAGFLGDLINKAVSGKNDSGPAEGTAKVEKPENFKGLAKVAIGQFSLAFYTKNVTYSGDSPFSNASNSRSEGEMVGMSAEALQETTDAIYDEFKRQMAVKGIEIVDSAGYKNTPMRANVKPEPQGATAAITLNKSDSAEAAVYWPTQLGYTDNVLLLLDGFTNITNMGNAQAAEKEYATSTGIPVMNVVLNVDFAAPVKSEKTFSGQTVSAKAKIAISHWGSQLTVIGPADGMFFGGGKVILQSPIVQEGDFAEVNGNETNGVTRGLLALAGMRGGMMKTSFKYSVTDANQYGTAVGIAASKAITLFLDQVTSNK